MRLTSWCFVILSAWALWRLFCLLGPLEVIVLCALAVVGLLLGAAVVLFLRVLRNCRNW